MASTSGLSELVENLRALLSNNAARFGLMVERQVQFALLPKLEGTRPALEPHLWSLLVLLLDGHEAPVPAADEALWRRALEAAQAGTTLAGDRPARFPKAAVAIAGAAVVLREVGVYPRPKLQGQAAPR